jgi:hypothetical protein
MYNKEIIVFDFILLVNFPVLVAFLLADQQKSTESGLKASKHFAETLMFISRPFFLVFFLFQPTWTRLWTQLKGAQNRTTIPTLKWRSWSYFKHL